MFGRGMEEGVVWIIPLTIIPLTFLRLCPSSSGHLHVRFGCGRPRCTAIRQKHAFPQRFFRAEAQRRSAASRNQIPPPPRIAQSAQREKKFCQKCAILRNSTAEKTLQGVSSCSFSAPPRLCARRSLGTVSVAAGRAAPFAPSRGSSRPPPHRHQPFSRPAPFCGLALRQNNP